MSIGKNIFEHMSDSGSYDNLFLQAEKLATDFSLFPEEQNFYADMKIAGLVPDKEIAKKINHLRNVSLDGYIGETVRPVEKTTRKSGRYLVKKLCPVIKWDYSLGPFYCCEAEFDWGNTRRRIGFIVQDRSHDNGVWMPQHHLEAVKRIREFAHYSIPIVTFIDTPGASANEKANANNQAHSISKLIAQMANIDVPTIGIIIGNGYSGGAIPLATTNFIFSVRDGVFNTIQPQGLSAIARKYGLSWQECARYVGVSAYELYEQGYVDGIIDFMPGQTGEKLKNLQLAIVSGIAAIENYTKSFVAENQYIVDHFLRSIQRFVKPTPELDSLQKASNLALASHPTECPNIFGVTYRYLRYVNIRRKVSSITSQHYGRLAKQEIPKGELVERIASERIAAFNTWLQDPDKIIYDETMHRAWKNYRSKRDSLKDTKTWLSRHIFGDPKHNYEQAKKEVIHTVGWYLYNRWKSNAFYNFISLINYLHTYKESYYLFQITDLKDCWRFVRKIVNQANPLDQFIYKNLSYECKKSIKEFIPQADAIAQLLGLITTELNCLIKKSCIYEKSELFQHLKLPTEIQLQIEKTAQETAKQPSLSLNRKILEIAYPEYIIIKKTVMKVKQKDLSILDIIINKSFRNDFIEECQNLIIFDATYNSIVGNLAVIASEANKSKNLNRETVNRLLDTILKSAIQKLLLQTKIKDNEPEQKALLTDQFSQWLPTFVHRSQCGKQLKQIEEWKKNIFPRISDTLFVIITFFFEKLVAEFYQSHNSPEKYRGKINPVKIGRKKNFWHRLTIAYNDLLIEQILRNEKRDNRITPSRIINKFFSDFKRINDNIITSDPCNFPGFRDSIEKAMHQQITPCGITTGIGTFRSKTYHKRVGVIISNLEFQAGAFDMASAEKVCKLLVECVRSRLPIIGFISSGGMQTKEGAGALFAMPIINDRFTRFVRDNDLPILIFGFGDCTGGAQASFVTHPVVQNYYFSGANIPFAGQLVVPSYLPFTTTLSNYLSLIPGAMRGLVTSPFASDLDKKLGEVDSNMPMPKETVEQVVQRVFEGKFQSEDEETAAAQEKAVISKKDLMKPVKRVLLHARGCTAVKIIPTAQAKGIAIVLIQSDPDMDTLPVDLLSSQDQVVCIGGNTPDESYLNALSVLRVAEHEQVDALHPGIGFLSENAHFADLCQNHMINFIGPSVSSMEIMGNKSNAIKTALAIQVPVVPGSHGVITSSEKAAIIADTIGYPVLLKAVHGGGGKGIQIVHEAAHIHDVFSTIAREAKNAFGNGDIYLEKYITSLRHIEVQILRDRFGNTKILGIRDCSVQRNNQKLIEESQSVMLAEQGHKKIYEYAEKIAKTIDYFGAGTVEFIYDLQTQSLHFMEMNTRLQVEHPVTELVSDINIVGAQFDIAGGASIADLQVEKKGYAMEVRINAEKAVMNADGKVSFLPTPGVVTRCDIPEQEGIQIISLIAKGKTVSPFYDSMVIQVIAHDQTRLSTINKMLAYLERIRIEGICTNIPLIQRVLSDKVFQKGIYDTNYLPNLLASINAQELIDEIEQKSGMGEQNLDQTDLIIEGSDEIKVLAPSAGVFYAAANPNESDFVTIGDTISIDKTLCLIEAMKFFTPVTLHSLNNVNQEIYSSKKDFEVTRINQTTGQQINKGDLLFVVKPIGGYKLPGDDS